MVELIVALAVMGALTAVIGITLHTASRERALPEWQYDVAAARDSSLRFGRSVMLVVRRDGGTYAVTVLPDGRVIADASLGIDPLSGKVQDAER